MTKQNKIEIIAFLFSVIALCAIIYFGINNQIKNTANHASTENTVNNYTNKQFGFSLTYPASQDTVEEVPTGVIFWQGDKNQNMSDFAVFAERTKYTDPSEEVAAINKENGPSDGSVGLDVRQVIDKYITVDGYPAIVTSLKKMKGMGSEVNPEKQVFFIKDSLLYTVQTNGEDDALWSSIKFNK